MSEREYGPLRMKYGLTPSEIDRAVRGDHYVAVRVALNDDEPCMCGTPFTCLARHDDTGDGAVTER